MIEMAATEATFQPARPPAPPAPTPQSCAPTTVPARGFKAVRYRLRHHKVPPVTMAALAIAAETAHLIGPWMGPLYASVATSGVYAATAWVAWLKAERQVKRDIEGRGLNRKDWRRIERRRRYQKVVTAGGATWLCWTFTGLGTAWSGVALVGLGGLFWLTHSLRYGLPTPAPAAKAAPVTAELVDDVAGRLKAALEQYVVHRGGALAAAGVEQWQNIDAGGRVMLQLVPGKQHIGMVRSLLPALKTALRCHDVTVDFADPGPNGDPGLVWVTAITRQEVARKDQRWDQPGLEPDGKVRIAGFVDGQGDSRVVLFEENGIFGGFALGDSGSGKSSAVKNILLSAAAGPEDPRLAAKYGGVVGVHLDGGKGASDPDLHEWCPIRAKGVEEIRFVLRFMEKLMDARYEENYVHKWDGFDAYSQGRAAYILACDEFHNYTPDLACRRIMARLSREGRKVGIALWCATQDYTLPAWGGHNGGDLLRSQVMAKNILVFHCMSANPRNLMPGINVDPREVTNQPGFFVPNGKGARTTEARTYYVAKGKLADYPSAQPSSADVGGLGQGYRDWIDSDPAARAYIEAKVRARATGASDPEPYVRPCLVPPAPAVVQQATPTAPPPVAAADPGRSAVLRLVDSMPSFDEEPAPAQLAPTAAAALGLSPRDAILLLLAEGVNRSGELEARSGYSEPTIRDACKKLVAAGLLSEKQSKHEPWNPTPQGWMAIGQAGVAHATAADALTRRTS